MTIFEVERDQTRQPHKPYFSILSFRVLKKVLENLALEVTFAAFFCLKFLSRLARSLSLFLKYSLTSPILEAAFFF